MNDETKKNKHTGLMNIVKSAVLILLCGAAGFGGGMLANAVAGNDSGDNIVLQDSTPDKKTKEDTSEETETASAALGIYVETISGSASMEDGVYIIGFSAGSKAESAGLEAGDRIISADGQEMSTGNEVSAYISTKEPGDIVELVIERNEEELTIKVELVEKTSSSRTGESFPSDDSQTKNG